jgi:HAE1 family hydrophobic/amphiphilic exporter-1
MGTFIDTFIRRPVFASMIILAMVVVGAAAYTGLGVDRLPSVDLPTINVRTSLPGASPEEVETEVSEVIEEAVNTVDGIEELRSISGPGNSFVIATFRLDRDIESAAQDVRDRIATVIRKLPTQADPPVVSKFDNDSAPVLTFALSGELSKRELSEIADKTVKPLLERSKGVGEVALVGQAERTVNVWVDANKLAALKIPITQLRQAIARENAEVPGGNITGSERESSLRTIGKLKTAAQFGEIVIARPGGAPLRLRDVARVEDGVAEERSVARLNGKPSVSLEIRRQSGANTVAVIDSVKENFQRVKAQLPAGVEMSIIRDQSRYINAALHEINVHLILGSILACLVVLLFTRSWRSVIIAGVAIPASVVSTFAMMYVLGFTLNSVTMLALVLMVGIVIDDAIVVLENIFRFVEEKKLTPMEAARQGTLEIATAVLATTLSLAVIFIPVSFMSSITGRFLYQFGITAAVAVIVSLVVSFVLTPTLSARMLRVQAHDASDTKGGFYGVIDRFYKLLLKIVMRGRWIAAIAGVLIIASSVPLFWLTPVSFMPDGADEGEFEMRLEAPQGTSFLAMDQVTREVERELSKFPEVKTVLASAGGGFIGGVNQGTIYVGLAPHEERVWSVERFIGSLFAGDPKASFRGNHSQTDVMQKIRRSMRANPMLRDVTVSVRGFPSFNIGGGNFDIDFSVTGPDLEQLAKYTDELGRRAEKLGGIINVDRTLRLDKPELRVDIDRDRASDLGVSAEDIGTALRLMVGGDEEVTRYRDPQTNEDYDVRLRLDAPFRSSNATVPNLFLAGSAGQLIELQNLASVRPAVAPARVDRLDRARDARVRGTLAPGAALGEMTNKLLAEAESMQMPPAYNVSVRGTGREFERTRVEFAIAFMLSIVFMYMILASQYENLVHPIVILLSLPLSVPFALVSLYLTGTSLNLYSALGLLVLFGVVKKNAILQIDHMNHLRSTGMPRAEAIIQGNRDRLRPILMTTLTLVAGMLPLWIGTGPGAEERRAVAVVVIGGQSLALLITLLLTPVAYSIFDDAADWVRGRRAARSEEGVVAAT